MAARTRLALTLGGAVLVVAGCVSSLQDRTAFKRADVLPAKIHAAIGDVVEFELRPPVREGTRWMLEAYPPVRFTRSEDRQLYDWVANGHPIHLEAVVGPWDVRIRGGDSGRTSWLWFSANDESDPEPLEMPLPIERAPYKELAPVTATSAFDVGSREPRLAASYSERADRVYVTYRTPIEKGTPHLPGIYPMLLETNGKQILYTEVWTDFGQYPFERVGYRVTLSYSAAVKGTIEVVVVEWTGHGDTAGPFDVHRMTISGLPSKETPASGPPPKGAPGATPSASAETPPASSAAPAREPAASAPSAAPPRASSASAPSKEAPAPSTSAR